jgi:hypothetical protein
MTPLELAEIIDTSWHYSWYWEHTPGGALSDAGIKRALRDCRKRIRDTVSELAALDRAEKHLTQWVQAGQVDEP